MSDSTLYDDDILLWSEQQAEVIRRLGRVGRAPNDLDVENVAEEIESVGRSELAAVESYIELILLHLIKLAIEPDAESSRHWQSEIVGFASRLQRRYAPSMQQRIDMDREWRSALRQATLAYGARGEPTAGLPSRCPISVADLLEEDVDIEGLSSRVRGLADSSAATKE
jgi:hypothetical protein